MVGFPWGPIYTVQAFAQNMVGGEQDPALNAELLRYAAEELIDRGDETGAVATLQESLRLSDDPDVRQRLWSLQGKLEDPTRIAQTSSPASSTFEPGALVRSTNGSMPMYAQPGGSGDPVGKLSSETAVVIRRHDRWLEVRVPGGGSGWIAATEIDAA